MLLALTGIGSLSTRSALSMEYLVAVRLADPGGRRKMERRIEGLRGHIIVAGLGRVGRQAVQEAAPFRHVVRRHRPEPGRRAPRGRAWIPLARGRRHGRCGASSEPACVARGGLIVTTGNDAANMYIILSARVLNPDLYIVSRAVDEASVTKLSRAAPIARSARTPSAATGWRISS
jgi:voltage-gated potassium channel